MKAIGKHPGERLDRQCHPQYHYAMTTTIDRAGRLVIPKQMREALNLFPGEVIEIEESDGGLLLRAAHHGFRLVEKSGFLVHQGSGKSEIAIADFINRQREGRAAGVARMP
jgi:AbrB family looped-hinge helix DNA binding protein